MPLPKRYAFEELSRSDLVIDAIYSGPRKGNSGDDPLNKLLRVSLGGGFRYRGKVKQDAAKLHILALTMSAVPDPDWPDFLDLENGVLTYFGDNQEPGRLLHETPRKGNEVLRKIFDWASSGKEGRIHVPPIFIFSNSGEFRDMKFRGLAVPGTIGGSFQEDLVAIWRTSRRQRFQNYRARFTVLDQALVSRSWLDDIILRQQVLTDNAPAAWLKWIKTGCIDALISKNSLEYRKKETQIPADEFGLSVIKMIHEHFRGHAHGFEYFAADIAKLALNNVSDIDVTRPSRDGGRDAIGYLRVGPAESSILVDFALEAKCYDMKHQVGVGELSRLISRLRHRQFGILVTTSYVGSQAYQEIKQDKHPIIVISAADIVHILRDHGYSELGKIKEWLNTSFPAQD